MRLDLHTYESWDRSFRKEVNKALSRKAEDLMIRQDNPLHSTQSVLNQITDYEFALRAQLTFTLFRITVDCIGMPDFVEHGFWTTNKVLNGYVLRAFSSSSPYEFEFGRYISGKGDGRFLEYTATSNWMIHEYKLSRVYQPPFISRRARLDEVWFDKSLNEKADELLADKLGQEFFKYNGDWRGSWAPQFG